MNVTEQAGASRMPFVANRRRSVPRNGTVRRGRPIAASGLPAAIAMRRSTIAARRAAIPIAMRQRVMTLTLLPLVLLTPPLLPSLLFKPFLVAAMFHLVLSPVARPMPPVRLGQRRGSGAEEKRGTESAGYERTKPH